MRRPSFASTFVWDKYIINPDLLLSVELTQEEATELLNRFHTMFPRFVRRQADFEERVKTRVRKVSHVAD